MATRIELQERVTELETAQARAELLYQISRDLNTARDEGELLQTLAQPAQEARAFRATLFYIDSDEVDEPEWFELVAHWEREDAPPVPAGTRYHLSELAVAHLWLSSMDEPLLIADVASDERLDEGEREVYRGFDTQATVIVPLTQAGHWVGLLTFNWDETREYSEQEIAIYQAFVGLAGPAVAARRLSKESRTQAEELAVLNELGQALAARLSVEEMLEEAHRQVSRLIDTTNFTIGLYDPEKHEIALAFTITKSEIDEQITTFSADQGLSGYMIRNRTGLLLKENIGAQHEKLGIKAVGEEAASWLGVPLIVGDRVLGMMSVQSYTIPRLYDEHDQDLLTTIANQTAIALQNAQLFEETHTRAERLDIVNRIAQAAGATLDPDALMEQVYQEIVLAFQADAFFIALYDEKAGELEFCFEMDEGVRQPSKRLPLGVGWTSFVVAEKKPLIIRYSEQAQKFLAKGVLTGTGKVPESWIGAPLMIGERVIGVISVQAYRPHVWDDEDEQLLFTIADQVAVALENARLFQERERRVAEMEIINEVGQAVTSVLDLDAVLRQIVDITKARFGHYFVSITLIEDERLVFRCGSTIGDSKVHLQPGQLSVDLKHESSLIAEVVQTGQPVLANDALNDPRYLPMEELPDTRCELSLPIKAKGRVVGVLDVQSDQPFAYDKADMNLLQALANEAGVAIENARLFEEARTRAEELAVLNELGQTLATCLDVEQILKEAYWEASRLLDATNFTIGLYDAEKNEIAFAFTTTESEIDREITRISADQGVSGYMICNRTSVLLEDNVGARQEALGIPMVGEEAKSWLGVPLIIGDRVLGTMTVQSYTAPRLYDEHDQDLLTAIASQVAIALQNARLFEEARIRAEELAVLNELGQALTARLNMEQVLEETFKGTARLLDTTSFYIALYDPETEIVSFPLAVEKGERVQWSPRQKGKGLTEYIIRTGTRLFMPENLPEQMGKLGVEAIGDTALSWLGAPLCIGDRVLGVMTCQSYTTSRLYDEHDRDLLTAIASQTAIALQNAQMFEETQRRVREMQLLHDIGLAAASGVRLEETLQAAAEALAAEFENFLVAILLLDQESNTLHLKASVGYPKDVIHRQRVPVGEGITGWVVQHGEPVLVPDMSLDPRCINFDGVDFDARSGLCVPMTTGTQVIGVLNIEGPQLNAFTDDDQRLLSTLASNLVVIVERARLFDNMEQMVADRTQELQGSLEERDRLQQEIIEAQKRAIQELSTPIIPVMDRIIVMPLIGSIDSMRARDIMRTLLAGIREHRAKVVILDITGVLIVDSGVANHLNKTIQAARLKGARTIVTGISDAVAETIVDLGIDWGEIETLTDLRTGLVTALGSLGLRLTR